MNSIIISNNAPIIDAKNTVRTIKNEKQKILGRMSEKSTQTSDIFLLQNNKFLYVEYGQPINYLNDNGKWIPINNTLISGTDEFSNPVLVTKDDPFSVSFGISLKANNLVQINNNGYNISWSLIDVTNIYNDSAAVRDTKIIDEALSYRDQMLNKPNITAALTYSEIKTGVDMNYTVTPTMIKENIILSNVDSYNDYSYSFHLKTGNLIAELLDGRVRFYDLTNPDVDIFVIPAAFMFDTVGATSNACSYTLTPDEDGYVFTLIADTAWIENSARVFPVTIDPVILTKQEIANYNFGYMQDNRSFNPSAYGSLYVGQDVGGMGQIKSLIKFDTLPTLDPGDVITNANLNAVELDYYNSATSTSTIIDAYRITSTWTGSGGQLNITEPTVYDQIMDYETASRSKAALNNATDAWLSWDITHMVQGWYENTYPNYGVMLKQHDAASDSYAQLVSPGYPEPSGVAVRPILEIEYINTSGISPVQSYYQVSLGGAGTGYVNKYTGALTFQAHGFAAPGNGLMARVNHVYNSTKVGKESLVEPFSGKGWQLNISQKLTEFANTANTLGQYERFQYIDATGGEHYFPRNDINGVPLTTVFTEEDNKKVKLTINSADTTNMYTIEDENHNKVTFESNFNFRSESNAAGNTVYYSFNGAALKTIQDRQRQYTVNYTTAGYLLNVNDANSRLIQYHYAGTNLASIEYPDATLTQFVYDPNDRLNSVTNANNQWVKFIYGSTTQTANRVVQIDNGAGATTGQSVRFTYNGNDTTVQTDAGLDDIIGTADDIHTTYNFDNIGRIASAYDDEGNAQAAQFITATDATNDKLSSAGIAQKPINNLALDSSGEFGDKFTGYSWAGTISGDTYTYDTTKSYIGRTSFQIVKTTTAQRNHFFQAVTLTPGTYTLSGYVSLTSNLTVVGSGGAAIYPLIGGAAINDSNYLTTVTDAAINGGWQRLSTTFTIYTAQSIDICMGIVNASGTAWFDCIQLEEAEVANPYNMIENGSFEIQSGGIAERWTGTSGVSSNYAKNGTYSYMLYGQYNSNQYVSQTVFTKGTEQDVYIVSGYSIASSVPLTKDGRDWALDVSVRYTDGTSKNTIVPFNVGSGWQFASGVVSCDDGNTGKLVDHVIVYCIYYNNANVAYFDNITLTKDTSQTYKYDSKGNLVAVNQTADKNNKYAYDASDNLQTATDPNNNTYTYHYTTNHQVSQAVTPTGTNFNFTYDTQGNVLTSTTKSGGGGAQIEATMAYTNAPTTTVGAAFPKTTTDALGNVTQYNYQIQTGNLLDKTDALLNKTVYTYDANNDKLLSVTAPDTVTKTSFQYNVNLLTNILHNGFNYEFDYDSFGNVVKTKINGTVASHTLMSNFYAPNNGKLLSSTYGNNDTITYEYDKYNRVVKTTYNDGTVYNNVYNDVGQITTVTDSENAATINAEYDSLGRVYSSNSVINGDVITAGVSYDANNNVVKNTYDINNESQTLTHTYGTGDLLSRTVATTPAGQSINNYTYDALSRVSQVMYESGGGTKFGMNNYSFVPGKNGTSTDTVLVSKLVNSTAGALSPITTNTFNYTYDANNNITVASEVSDSGALNYNWYKYESLNQLIRADIEDVVNSANSKSVVYAYDKGGNITTETVYPFTTGTLGTPTATNTYGYDQTTWNDLLTSYNGVTITYDTIGNPLNYYDGTVFTWSKGKRLSTAINGVYNISYKYDRSGIRTEKTINGVTTKYIASGGKLIYQNDGNNKFNFYYDGHGSRFMFTLNGKEYFYQYNNQGDVIGIVSASADAASGSAAGAQVVHYTYDAYGNLLSTTGTMAGTVGALNPFLYRGYYYDSEIGLYYLQSRYYDPTLGRFISADTMEYTTGSKNFNLFSYCENNPIMFIDPTGHMSGTQALAYIGLGKLLYMSLAEISAIITETLLPILIEIFWWCVYAVAAILVAAIAATVIWQYHELSIIHKLKKGISKIEIKPGYIDLNLFKDKWGKPPKKPGGKSTAKWIAFGYYLINDTSHHNGPAYKLYSEVGDVILATVDELGKIIKEY